ncbi:MAG TPA: M28 family peptidase [Gemmatimonadales bacterium]
MRRVACLVYAGLAVPCFLSAQRSGPDAAVGSISSTAYQRLIGVIAHDSMMGRDTPSRGLDLTAQWVANEFRRLGLTPGGDGGEYIQRYPIQQVRIDPRASSVAVRGGPTWRVGREVMRTFGGFAPDGVTGRTVIVSGQARNGAAYGTMELEGAVVFVVLPTENGRLAGREAQLMLRGLSARNPAALIGIADVNDEVWRDYATRQSATSVRIPWRERGNGTPIVLMRDPSVQSLLRDHGFDLASARRRPANLAAEPLTGLALTVTMTPQLAGAFEAPNTVGILEGSDPQLKNEYLVYSAHMDHVGTAGTNCRASGADTICNGADDDASGTVGIVQLARAYAMLSPRPRRSIIFLTVSGEEKGLWGSDYFAGHPPVPIGQIVADLNADMIGRNWPDTIVAIGKEHSDLGATLNRVNAAHPELRMTAIDDIWPNERFYFRSDHYNFARRGVPILFFFNGTHPDYHRPSDEVDEIDSEKASRIVRLLFYIGLDVANADRRPQWNPESYKEIVSSSDR